MNWKRRIIAGLLISILVSTMAISAYTSGTSFRNTVTSAPVELWNYKVGNDINDIAMSQNGEFVAIASQDGYLYLLNQNGKLQWKHDFGSTPPVSVDMSEYGTYIFVGAGTSVYLFNIQGTSLGSFNTAGTQATGYVYHVDITPDGKYAVSFGDYIDFFNLSSGNLGSYQWFTHPSYSVFYGKVSDDGSYVFASPADSKYYHTSNDDILFYTGKGYHPATPKLHPNSPLWTFSDPNNGVIRDADMSNDGKYVVVGTYNDYLYLINNDGTVKWSYSANNHVYAVSISADDKYVAADVSGWLYIFSTSSSNYKWKDFENCWYISFIQSEDVVVAADLPSSSTTYHIWAKNMANQTAWESTYNYNWAFFSSQSHSRFGRAISGDGQYFAGADSNFKVHFIGPSSVPELNMPTTILLFAVVAMGAVALRKRH